MYFKTMFLTKIVMVIMLTCAALADEPKIEDRCSALAKCSKCTVEAWERGEGADEEVGGGTCEWSMERQTCLLRTFDPDPTTTSTISTKAVRHPADCPRFTVDRKRAIFGDKFTYSVDVLNDGEADFIAYLARVGFTCLISDGGPLGGRLTGQINGTVIECEPVIRKRWPYFGDREPPMKVVHFYIVFGEHNTTLRLDDEADYYAAFYPRDCNEDGGYDDGCVDCAWTTDDSRYYVKRCSIRNQCVGPFEFYDSRRLKGVDTHLSSWSNGQRTMCEQAITVEWFEPTEVRWTMDSVTMKVAVRNHRILADGATVRVTVAGHKCMNPLTSPDDADVLTCTVSTGPTAGGEGPVRVVYTTHLELAVESSQRFNYVSPKVTGVVGPSCGPVAGGTRLTGSLPPIF